jgi:hypothetical protein
MGFEDKRQEAAPEEPRTIWRLDGPLLARRLHLAVPEGLCWQYLWPFLDDPTSKTRHLINLEEFTDCGTPL